MHFIQNSTFVLNKTIILACTLYCLLLYICRQQTFKPAQQHSRLVVAWGPKVLTTRGYLSLTITTYTKRVVVPVFVPFLLFNKISVGVPIPPVPSKKLAPKESQRHWRS
jgi:hypothetical protein